MKKIFRYQIWHLLCLLILIAAVQLLINYDGNLVAGELEGITTKTWFWIAIGIPILHQVYVWIIWRLELYHKTFTSRYGVLKAFNLFAAGFSVLFVSRLISIIILAFSSRDSLTTNSFIVYIAVGIITPLVIYLFYSVKKYFTINRAYGIDHFDKNYNKPYVKEGIFRYTNNGMYVFGFMILYLPGLLLFSKAALAVALFNHIYIWVHYYFTELPDMKVIFGKTPVAPDRYNSIS